METHHLNGVEIGSGIQMEILAVGMTATDDGSKTSYNFAPLIQVATVTLTNAEIKALRATPKTLVAAPGAGKFLEFVSASLKLVAGANVLSESTANLAVKYTDGSGAAVSQTIEATGLHRPSSEYLHHGLAEDRRNRCFNGPDQQSTGAPQPWRRRIRRQRRG